MAARVTQARWVALNLVRAVRDGELLDPAFARLAPQLTPRDRAWLQELVYGTLRLRGRIDALLSRFLRRSITQLDPDVLDILRLGAYQLLEMHGVPAYAAVSQAVEMTRETRGQALTGLVNGVLQSLRRAQPQQLAQDTGDPVSALCAWGSHPRWLVERWLGFFGVAETEALLEANNQRPALYLRILDGETTSAQARLAEAGMDTAPVPGLDSMLRLVTGDVARALELVPAIVQDPAALLVTEFAAFDEKWAADLCAAPGGKALGLSRAGQHGRFVVASDVSFARLRRVRDNVARTRSNNVALVNADARQLPMRALPQVLLNVPCTGTGTLRRHPDGKWRLDPAGLQSLLLLQQQLLDEVAPRIAASGLLVYATCSLEPEENEQQVEHFLNRHPDFSLEPAPSAQARYLDGPVLRVLPQRHGFDGAFAARLRKAA